ncbi:hypothetical protein D6D03_10545 [Aureobasidium pullulans]|nr:hypothetical protein D6D03_10545 [Aureobasidium pullulans]
MAWDALVQGKLSRTSKAITLHRPPSTFETSQLQISHHLKTTSNMYTQATMGRGGYNRNSTITLGRGGYNRDVKTSGISRPNNPSSLTVRSARSADKDDGRGGYN